MLYSSKLLALNSEVCFHDCSGFCVNELKFHVNGAPCPCQHILQRESWAGLMSTHLPHRVSLMGSSPPKSKPSPQDKERWRVRQGDWEEGKPRVSAFKLQFYPAPRSLRGWGHSIFPCFMSRAPRGAQNCYSSATVRWMYRTTQSPPHHTRLGPIHRRFLPFKYNSARKRQDDHKMTIE